MVLSEEQEKEVARIEEAVCDFFGINIEDLSAETKKSVCSKARRLVVYILHYQYRLSESLLSKRYNRTRRTIRRQNAQTRVFLEAYKEDRSLLESLLNHILEWKAK